ncbi:MAG: hypothetical protein P1U42_06470 [Phycisphaerales bacterium]|nr:hypothetical protein [Phycisphaerales bacterium]
MKMESRLWGHLVYSSIVAISALSLFGCGDEIYDADADPTLRVNRILGESGSQQGQYVYPRAMDVFIENDHPFAAIIDKTARVQILDLESGSVIGSVHTPRWDRGKPTGVTVGPSAIDGSNLAIYIADTHEHRVLMYELPLPDVDIAVATEPDIMFGSFGEGPSYFVYPTDVAVEVDENGEVSHLYVSEYGGNDRISRFKVIRQSNVNTIAPTEGPGFVFEYQIGTASEEVDASDGPVALSRPQSIALWTNPQGVRELIVTDASHHRVGRLQIANFENSQSQLIQWFGHPLNVSNDAYRFPYGLTVLDDGTALITEFGANRIRCINIESGELLWKYGVDGRAEGQLAQPWACGVITNSENKDQIVILDSGNNRLQICDLPLGVSQIGHELDQWDLVVDRFGINGSESP